MKKRQREGKMRHNNKVWQEGGKNANFICIIWNVFWQMNWMWAMYKLVSH